MSELNPIRNPSVSEPSIQKPFRLFGPGFRTNWAKVGATSLLNGAAVSGAWSFGVLVGSMINASINSLTCD